jgi:enamine deaminase RidA (YjgF/YER057c/UK114 family)
MSVGKPLANYAACRRVGDFIYMSGVIAVDPATRKVVMHYEDIPPAGRQQLAAIGYEGGQMSVDVFEAPILAQSWFVLERIRQLIVAEGGSIADVFKLVQYFRDLRHYPYYNRVRSAFFAEAPVSTVVEVSRFLPSDDVLIEVEATAYLPRPPAHA